MTKFMTENRKLLKSSKCRMLFTANRVDRNICTNNCKEYDRINRKCLEGFNFKPKSK